MNYWNLLSEMEYLRREMDRFFDLSRASRSAFLSDSFLPGLEARQYPLVNVSEDKDTFYVEALAPGVNSEKLDISVVGNTLTIKGEKNASGSGVKADAYHRNERATGPFIRSIELPHEVSEEKTKAEYKNGLLFITASKSEEAKPKNIIVHVQ